jgi:hypothetical protein
MVSMLWNRGSQHRPRGPSTQQEDEALSPSKFGIEPHHHPTRCCRASDKTFPLRGKEVREPLPLAGEGRVLKNALPPGGGKKAYERRLPPCREERVDEKARDHSRKPRTPDAWRPYPAGRSIVSSRERAWRTHGVNTLQRASRRHHYKRHRGKCRRD